MVGELRALRPPSAVSAAHDDYVETLQQVLGAEDQVAGTLATAEGTTVDEFLDVVGGQSTVGGLFERAGSICRTIQDFAYLRGGRRPCSADGG